MSLDESFAKHWQLVASGEHADIGRIHVHLVYQHLSDGGHFTIQLEHLNGLLRECFHSVAERRGGKLTSWDHSGGTFVFPVEGRDSYDNCCLAAIQMLEMMPFINQDIQSSEAAGCRVGARISCDAGAVASDPESSDIPALLEQDLAAHGGPNSTDNRVTITERLYRQLTQQCQSKFASWKRSADFKRELYRTSRLYEVVSSHDSSISSLSPLPCPEVTQACAGDAKHSAEPLPPKGRLQRFGRRIGPWQIAVIGLVALLVAQLFVVWAVIPKAPFPVAAANTFWEEQVRSSEWITWRKRFHEIVSASPVTEETLATALRVKRPEIRTPPAAVLRHDQAMGDVLQSYPRVRTLIRGRLGIYEEFLGTGFSSPVNAQDYDAVSLHEYLIPNLPDDDPRVWMRKIKLVNMAQASDMTIQELIEEKAEEDDAKQEFTRSIISHAEAGHRETVLIRFAILNTKKDQYKGTLGRPERERVFASDLVEVWKLKIKDAADRSGYTLGGGDTFFVWVFMPVHKQEAVLATWGQVLDHLPEWMEHAQTRRP